MPFRFGIEVEFLLGSLKTQNVSQTALFREVKERLSEAGINSIVFKSNDKSEERYTTWSITTEVTVQGEPSQCLHAVEIVSPIYTTDSHWERDLHTLFSVINKHFQMGPSDKCGTHVHISRTTLFSAPELANLAKATLYFESALDSLMPATRSNNDQSYWCQSNRNSTNPSFAGLSLKACLDKIDAAATSISTTAAGAGHPLRPIVEVMNLCSHETKLARVWGKTAPFVRGKTHKWDFTGLLAPAESVTSDRDLGVTDTVEFRQPPGSRTAGEAEAWVKLTVAFVVGAVDGGLLFRREEGGTVQELRELVGRGMELLGWKGSEVLEGLFAQPFRGLS